MNTEFFRQNRISLSAKLNGGVAVFSAYATMQRGNDAAFQFEQEANFWYLTGVKEPNWQLIIVGTRQKSWLVAPDSSEMHRTFEGELTPEEAVKISGIGEVLSQDDATTMLRDLAKRHSVVYTLGTHPQQGYFDFIENPAQKKLTSLLERTFNAVQDCRKELTQLRAIKQPEEIVAIKKAVKLTVEAFEVVRKKLPHLRYEYEIEAEFDYYFKKHGASHAYNPIVAAGKNACTLHYGKNSQSLKKNTLVLMDIGARRHGYTADLTRTYAFGQATRRQREVYAEVRTAHEEIIALLKPGLSVKEYHEQVDRVMQRAIGRLGLMMDDDEVAYRRYFPHAISHGLGIDVHDSLGGADTLREGMVLTVEPGIYIPEESIGVRVEDDILITAKGRTNLSTRLSTELS